VGERDKASRDLELLNSDPMSIWVTRHSRMSGGRDGSPVGAIEHKSGADVEQHDGVPGAEIVLGVGVAKWGEGRWRMGGESTMCPVWCLREGGIIF
jgi:hypothetical protein